MRLGPDALARIVAAASTLDERMNGAFEPLEPGGGPLGEARLERWRRRVADGDPSRFRRRLRAEGWSEAAALAALGPVRPRTGAALPAWALTVAEAVALPGGRPPDRAVRADAPVPFQDVLLPFVAIARRRSEVHPRISLLAASARAALERALLRCLSCECGEALAVERAAFGAVWQGADAEAAFAARMANGGVAALAARLPVLARLLGTHVEHWAAATAELLDRLAADRRLLRAAFAGGRPLGRVREVDAALSDPHRGGRTVSVLVFDSGCRVVYKPRPLGVDAAWQALLRWLNTRAARPDLRPLAVLDRGAYGWVEHAAPHPCRGAREAARFHERAGALLCLAYVLGGSDLHAENVVAAGPHPVLVDLEMLLSASRRGAGGGDAAAAHAGSVLRTGLLPQWVPGPRGAARREGGLAADAPAGEDARRVEAGFARTYRALLRLRGELFAPGGPLQALAGAEVRVLVRATRVYDALLRRARHPSFLACGVDRDVELDALCRPWLAPGAPQGAWTALRVERADLAGGDVPLFTTGAGATRVRDGRGADVGALRERPGYADAVRRLRGLGPADLAVQRRLVRLAFGPTRPWCGDADGDDGEAFTCEAAAVAEQLLGTAVRGARGDATWLTSTARPGGEARFAPAGLDLAHGRTGTALFLAACATKGRPRCRDAALAALGPLLRGLREPGFARRLAAAAGIGAACGAGGVVYALTRIAGFLGDEAPLRAAAAAAAAISPAAVAADRVLDVYSGSAGAALALLALHAATGCDDALQRAAACGRHLLAHAGRGAPAHGGLAHGAAGVGHALLRLHRATGEAVFRVGAERAFAASARARSTAARSATWCRGATGTLLACAAASDLLGSPARRRTLAARAAEAGRAPLQATDTLCCGNLGTIELLLVAAERLGRPALREAALARAGQVLQRARARRSYATVVEDRYAPGFLQGAAGIGYGLLRLGDPARFPSALLWE